MLFVAGCGGDDYDDTAIRNEISDLANRVAKLEQLCQQMNTNISSLQTIVNALQKNDYITAVTPITQNGKVVGYTIAFAKSGAITIYHGQDGKDGANGKDGYTPQIGVKKDTDGYYYWTLDGKWLTDESGNKIKAVGTNGKDGEDGQDGKPGSDGEDGQDGQDGITPQLKIEEGYWYVSYDNGSSWIQLGKATGEDGADGSDGIDGSDGKDGVDGEDGDSIFSGVSQDDEFVYFHLSDGTMITLPKHDKENIQFEDLNVKVICCKNWDANNDGELSYDEAAVVTDLGSEFMENTSIIAFNELKYFTGLKTIADKAFYECTNLWKIQLPESLEKIGNRVFYNCVALASIKIPESTTSIGTHTFYGCENLATPITIPQGVTSISGYLFYQCLKLPNVILHAGVTKLGVRCFYDCHFETFIVPSSVTQVTGCCIPYAKTIYCLPTVPPTAVAPPYGPWSIVENGEGVENIKIFIPKGSLEAYQNANKWSEYKANFEEYDFENNPI